MSATGTVRPYGYPSGVGPVQVVHSEPIDPLAYVEGSGEGGQTGEVRFRVETPDSRLRVKIGILFIRTVANANLVSNLGATLWMGEEESDRSGYIGSKIVANDILRDAAGNLIHQSAPLAIPEDPGLEGWSQEMVTAADSLLGIFTTSQDVGGVAGATGYWILQARWQPDGQRLHDCDWDQVVRGCRITLLGPRINLPVIIG